MVGILFMLSIISVLDRNIITLLVGPIKSHFGLTDVQMSLLIGAAFSVPFGVLSIPLGWAIDRLERRPIVAVGIAVWSLATIATGLARTYAELFVARCCVGAGDATLAPANSSLLSDLFPRHKLALPMALASMGFKAGQGAALIVGGMLTLWIAPGATYDVAFLGVMKGWQLIFVVVGLPGLLFIPLIFSVREPIRRGVDFSRATGEASYSDYMRFVRGHLRFFVGHHLGVLLLITMAYTLIAWMPSYLTRVYGWSENMAGGSLGTAFLVGPLLGMPLHGAVADWLFRRGLKDAHLRYPLFAVLLAAPVGIVALMVSSPMLAVLLAGLYTFIISGYVSLPLTALVGITPSRLRGKAAAILGLGCVTTGTLIGPLMVGFLTDRVFGDPRMVGYSIMICIACLAPMIAACFGLALGPLRNASPREPRVTNDGERNTGKQ
jgi:MFS family permease